jgi:hypothetical protein
MVRSVIRSLVLLSLCACATAPPASAPTAPTAPTANSATSTAKESDPLARLFDVHVGFWVNLHQRLYAESGLSARSRPIPDPLRATAPADQETWDRAVAFYKGRYTDRGLVTLLFDKELSVVNRRLAALEAAPSLAESGLAAELVTALEAAAPVYRRTLWSKDERRAFELRDRLRPLVAGHGAALSRAMVKAYATEWSAPVRLDLAAYAGPVGAYTMNEPAHITLATADTRHEGDTLLEIVFHEASHPLVQRVEASIERATAARHKEAPPGLWHAVLFYFTGELVRRELGPSYVPYARKNGLYEHDPSWKAAESVLDRVWPAYLDGRATLDATIDEVAAGQP